MPTAEIYKINDNGTREYAGYAKFDREGNYQGSRGGYGSRQNPRNASEGRGNNEMRLNNGGYRYQGNNRRNNASRMQNDINLASAKSANRLRIR